ncbi:MAG TPA: DUF5666 domain-containing protein [Candidatus Binatia bacterium]|nr:DUF5666 domain-containing protein [Candidatus Binatia bacterium]
MSSSQNPNPQPNTTPLQVNIGDAPSDRLVAVSMTIGSMSLTKSGGGSISVVSSSTPVEMMHLMGTVDPISLMNVPQGTYSGATMSISSATVMYMDPTTMQLVQKSVSGPMNATVNFIPSLTVGTSPMVVNLDMNMASSVSIDQSGNVTMTPTMTASMNPCCTGNSQDPEYGGMEHMTGTVMNFAGSSFTMSMMQSSQNISVTTGSGTQFEGMGGMGGMSNGMILMVDAIMQNDGTFMAQKIQSIMPMSGSSMGAGLVTSVTGNPVTQLTLVMHEGTGNGMMGSQLAGTTTVNVSPTAVFGIDSDNVDMSNLPFAPTFDATTIFKGQRVEAVSSTGMMSGGGMGSMMGGGTINASEIDLEEQGLSGTVSGYTGSGAPTTFTLTVPSDSAFTTLTGATAVTVLQQPGTELWGVTTITNGSTVHIRGLLFFDASTYKLVAGRIMAP